MNSLGFRVFCITIAALFFFESAFSTAFIGDTKKTELHKSSCGQLNKIEDINENEINFGFNTHGHVSWIQDQLGNETEAAYDLMGRLLSVTTPMGRTYTVQYDDWGRPERLLFPQVYNEQTEQWETHDVSVEYDHGSLITLLRDELGRETSLFYDDAMRLVQVTNAEEQEIFFDYYDSGALQNFTNGRGKTTTYIYNSRWELFEIYLPDNSQDPYESFQYDDDGNLAGYQNALGQIISYEYDDAGRLTLIDYPTGTDTSISYDDADRVTGVTDLSGTTSWTYNAAYELVALSMPQGGLEYEYDDLGRLWKLIKNGTAVTEYGYDDASRLVSILNPYNELTEFEYDDDSKLIRKFFANGTKEEYSYDERSRLMGIVLKKSNNDVLSSHEYVYDAVSNIIARDDNGTVTEFAYDLIDQLLSETKQGYSAEYVYDANGSLVDYSGTWSGQFAYGGAFGYQSDDDSGLMLLGHRYYDASTGRFLSRDPVGDGGNWYVYCVGNPVKYFDTDGRGVKESVDGTIIWFSAVSIWGGIVRDLYNNEVKKLDRKDNFGRFLLKEKWRQKTPEPYRSFLPKPTADGNSANKTNPGWNKLGKGVKVLGFVGLAYALVDDGIAIYTATAGNRGRTTSGVIGGWIGAVIGGIIGGFGGAFISGGNPAAAVGGGVIGSAAGGYCGSDIGEWFYDTIISWH